MEPRRSRSRSFELAVCAGLGMVKEREMGWDFGVEGCSKWGLWWRSESGGGLERRRTLESCLTAGKGGFFLGLFGGGLAGFRRNSVRKMLSPSLRGCCKSAALSGLLRVQKLSNFSLFKATAAVVFCGFQPNFALQLRPFKAAVAATFLGF
ncbi:hypothetical protein H5410_037495 [Solanum commersonii]|uniref:Uncharacterized protein n=1 Tax=Solanum commersonii TaxID=4109 RepID=A0A9J5Y8M1_SOLCO|nr:hypothetical protein H5410_037495 [Solanum commersonii]